MTVIIQGSARTGYNNRKGERMFLPQSTGVPPCHSRSDGDCTMFWTRPRLGSKGAECSPFGHRYTLSSSSRISVTLNLKFVRERYPQVEQGSTPSRPTSRDKPSEWPIEVTVDSRFTIGPDCNSNWFTRYANFTARSKRWETATPSLTELLRIIHHRRLTGKLIKSPLRFLLCYGLLQHSHRFFPNLTPKACTQHKLKAPHFMHLPQYFESLVIP